LCCATWTLILAKFACKTLRFRSSYIHFITLDVNKFCCINQEVVPAYTSGKLFHLDKMSWSWVKRQVPSDSIMNIWRWHLQINRWLGDITTTGRLIS